MAAVWGKVRPRLESQKDIQHRMGLGGNTKKRIKKRYETEKARRAPSTVPHPTHPK
jgi:hypothetical protein